MRHQIVAALKSCVRPIAQQRWRIEKYKYGNATILGPQAGNDRIAELLQTQPAAAIGKMGASELGGVRHYLKHRDASGHCERWGRHSTMLHRNAGVYPQDPVIFSRFCQEFLSAVGQLDLMAAWFRPGEADVKKRYAPQAEMTELTALEPFYHERPWSRHLAGKRVLVITPFADTIRRQYANRRAVWPAHPEVLPDFELDTLRCPLSAALEAPAFADWFVALDAMRNEMAKRSFDVVIVGAGAWSLPLVAHAKQLGRWGIHLGGPTQILFGVMGGRWKGNRFLNALDTSAWVNPDPSDTPKNRGSVENGCYW